MVRYINFIVLCAVLKGTVAIAECDVKDFYQHVEHNNTSAVAWHLMTLQTENEAQSNSLTASGAINYLGILSAGGGGGTQSQQSRQYLNELEEDYSAQITDSLILSNLNSAGLEAYRECLKTHVTGLTAKLGARTPKTIAVHWNWSPDVDAPESGELVLSLTDASDAATKYLEDKQGFFRKYLDFLTPKDEILKTTIKKNQSDNFSVLLDEAPYSIKLRVGNGPPRNMAIPGLGQLDIHYFSGHTAVSNVCSTADDKILVARKYTDFHNQRRVIAVKANSTARGDAWVESGVDVFYSIDDGELTSCASSGELQQAARAKQVFAECKIVVPRNSDVTVKASGRNHAGSTTATCLSIFD